MGYASHLCDPGLVDQRFETSVVPLKKARQFKPVFGFGAVLSDADPLVDGKPSKRVFVPVKPDDIKGDSEGELWLVKATGEYIVLSERTSGGRIKVLIKVELDRRVEHTTAEFELQSSPPISCQLVTKSGSKVLSVVDVVSSREQGKTYVLGGGWFVITTVYHARHPLTGERFTCYVGPSVVDKHGLAVESAALRERLNLTEPGDLDKYIKLLSRAPKDLVDFLRTGAARPQSLAS